MTRDVRFIETENNGNGWMELYYSEHQARQQSEYLGRVNKGDGFKYPAKQVTIRACGLTFKQWAVICHAA